MKKLLATMMTVLVVAAMSMPAYAKVSDVDVWIGTHSGTVEDSKLIVSVETNGTATDGLLNIVYDSSKVSCTEESVVFDENVDMYSVNAEEEGVLKISYVSDDAIEEGEFIDLSFELISNGSNGIKNAKDAGVELSGEAHNADGEDLKVGMKKTNNGNSKKYTITVNGEVVQEAKYNQKVTIKAAKAPEGQKFAGWKLNGSDTVVSTEEKYTFFVSGDMDFEACYTADAEEVKQAPEALLSNYIVTESSKAGKYDVKFVAQLVVPEGYTVNEAGLVWSNKGKAYADEKKLNLDMEGTDGVKVTRIKAISNTWQFSVTIKGVPSGTKLPGRIFAEMVNGEGKTVYSDIEIVEVK